MTMMISKCGQYKVNSSFSGGYWVQGPNGIKRYAKTAGRAMEIFNEYIGG